MMMTVMFLMVFDAAVIAAPISLQVLMLPFLWMNFCTPSHRFYLRVVCTWLCFGLALHGFVYVYVVGNLLTHTQVRVDRIL